jgi:ABC-type multidrug transport system, ATPase component
VTLELEGVEKRYGDVTAVDGVSLRLGSDSFHCLLGPNGSGKTTLLRLVLGLTNPTSGTVSVTEGTVGCGFQQPNFYPGLTVRENIDVFAGLAGTPDEGWRRRLVSQLRLGRALDRPAADLSGGFARKLDLALALLKQPDYLLLDEPLGALDDVSKSRLLSFLDDYAAAGRTVVASTHHVTDFEPVLDRVTVMHEGRIVLDRDRAAIDLGGADSLQEYYLGLVLARDGADSPDGTRPGDR